MVERTDVWWRNAIFYAVDVATYFDANGDGIGDISGLTSRLDHLSNLGVTCLWLLPPYPSPWDDDGYDISDFYGIHPALGSLGDFVEFIEAATERGIRVLVDLVANHTSVEHAWFQEARRDPSSPKRDFYIWSDDPTRDTDSLVFPGEEDRIWTYDDEANAWYHHRFYSFEPDLNMWNPKVREEIHRVMGFWLQLGVSGFRVDAAPYLLQRKIHAPPKGDPHVYLRQFRAFLSRRRGDAVLLGEANLPLEEQLEYFGGERADELHLQFNFGLNRQLYLAMAREEAAPLAGQLEQQPLLPAWCQWLNFIRTHDELNLGGLGDDELDEVLDAFGVEGEEAIYGRGLRRRLPSIVGGDRRRIELAYSILFSLPGAPMLLWGEEIGMGEDLSLPGRLSVRTPMQWSDAPNGGFSSAAAEALVRPVVQDGPFGFDHVNVAAQRREAGSLLAWMERLIRTRKLCPEIGWGGARVCATDDPGVLVHRCDWRGGTVIAVHNLTGSPGRVDLSEQTGAEEELIEIFGDDPYRRLPSEGSEVDLAPYGYHWFRVRREHQELALL